MYSSQVRLRGMRQGERRQLLDLARKNFTLIERVEISRPEAAIVAEVGDEIVGCLFLREFSSGGARKVGYMELGFILRKHRGRGIGRFLYVAAIKKLKEDGCEKIVGLVKHNNVVSWGLLQKQGFRKPGFLELVRTFGLPGAFRVWSGTLWTVACGMDLWMSDCEGAGKTIPELAAFFGFNAAFLCTHIVNAFLSRGFPGQPPTLSAVGAGILVLFTSVLVGVGGLLSRRRWKFRLIRGGLLVSFLLPALGGILPLMGQWTPERHEDTPAFRRQVGLLALIEWLTLLALFAGALAWAPATGFWHLVMRYSGLTLLFRVIPVYPFEHFGGARVREWNAPLHRVMAAGTLLITAVGLHIAYA